MFIRNRCGSKFAFAVTVGSLVLTAFARPARPTTENILKAFQQGPRGANPYSGVTRDASGNLYGTTFAGGAYGFGVVYKVTPQGQQTVLYSFTGGADGAQPYGGVIGDGSGNLYGTTSAGGTKNAGVVYKLTSSGSESVLYTFTGGSDGSAPEATLIKDANGNFYGTAPYGGVSDAGVVFRITLSGVYTVLYGFRGGATDGSTPYGGVIRDEAGNLYGTTYAGGPANAGTVFKVNPSGQESVLHSFSSGSDGQGPDAGVVRDKAGDLYGTTILGGAAQSGVVFKVTATGQESVLYSFAGGTDGSEPPQIFLSSAGTLYGCAFAGGTYGAGLVYSLSTQGVKTDLYNFTGGTDGAFPMAGLIEDASGNLYSATYQGGYGGLGVVFELTQSGDLTGLYHFAGGLSGANPSAALIRDTAGDLYGTTPNGGAHGWGAIFKVDASGTLTVLYSFAGGPDGANPRAALVQDSSGNLYGTTSSGGTSGFGTVYKFNSSGETVLYSFKGGADGADPVSTLILDGKGSLYGTTYSGGPANAGTVFKLTATGSESILYAFLGLADGANPAAGVIADASGNLYGTTFNGGSDGFGVVFKLSTGGQSVLHSFLGGNSDGANPAAGLIADSAGNLFGTTEYGNSFQAGIVFKIDSSGNEKQVFQFNGVNNGGHPQSGVILDQEGNLYGTTYDGGSHSAGVVYEIVSGRETIIHSFQGGMDGLRSQAGLLADAAGNLYGTTISGGSGQGGVIFELVSAETPH